MVRSVSDSTGKKLADTSGKDPVDKVPSDSSARRRLADTKKWGKCIALLLGAAVLQAAVGFWALQSRSEAVTQDFLVNSGGVAGPLALFADPEAPFVVENHEEGKSILDPGDVAVLVISSGKQVWLLRATLQSLSRVDGVRPSNVLVSLGSPGRPVQLDLIAELGFSCAGFKEKGWGKKYFQVFEEAATGVSHLHRSLDFAKTHFEGKELRSLVVLEEGQIFSLDLLWYFVQLIPLLRHLT
eukprot:symbB.v1.2.036842.t1/scaffold5296.1/size28725/2